MQLPFVTLACLLFAGAWATPENPSSTLKERAHQVHPGTPACSTVATSPKPFHLRCGAEGSLSNPVPIISNVKVSTFDDCVALCLDSRQCASFSFKTKGSKCTLYSAAIVRQDFTKGSTGVYFYNRSCYKVVCDCPTGLTLCGTYCANTLRDTGNCGACGHQCGATETCYQGVCYPTACSNVIDCQNGYYGSDVDCGSTGADCFCTDNEGADTGGYCALNDSCSVFDHCKSSDQCKDGYICSLRTCCDVGICIKVLRPQCRNENAPPRIFAKPRYKGQLTAKGYME